MDGIIEGMLQDEMIWCL